MTSPSITIVDDEQSIRDSLTALLGSYGFECSSYANGRDFLDSFPNRDASCILLDINLNDMNGLDVLREVKKREHQSAVVMITGFGDVQTAVKSMQCGASDFVEKPIDPDRLIEAVEFAVQSMRASQVNANGAVDIHLSPLAELSKREREVLVKVAEGHPNKVVAYELSISMRTVEVHRSRIMKKTGVKNFSELVRLAINSGLI